jgi:hypothetical protein
MLLMAGIPVYIAVKVWPQVRKPGDMPALEPLAADADIPPAERVEGSHVS